MDGVDIFQNSVSKATTVVKQVRADHLLNSTPNSEWNVRDLLDHMIAIINNFSKTLHDNFVMSEEVTDTDIEDEIVDSDPSDISNRWQVAIDMADAAIDESDTEEVILTEHGLISIDDYARQVGADLLVHAWDLGKSIGVPVHFDSLIAEAVYEDVKPNRNEENACMYSKPLEVSKEADIQTRLLAFFGRDREWQAT